MIIQTELAKELTQQALQKAAIAWIPEQWEEVAKLLLKAAAAAYSAAEGMYAEERKIARRKEKD